MGGKSKPNFSKVKRRATRLLLRQNISSLDFDVRQFVLSPNVFLDSIQNYCSIVGFNVSDFISNGFIENAMTIKWGNTDIILYNDDEVNPHRKKWGITHEVGHSYMGHEKDDEIEEIEGHCFAAQICMPDAALAYLSAQVPRLSYKEISEVFNVSHAAAKKKITTLNKFTSYSYTALDKELIEKVKPLLDEAVCVLHEDRHYNNRIFAI